MTSELFRYTPALKNPQDLKKSLVGREKELERVFKTLEEGTDRKANQSFLFVGPRGIGKTHLLLLIYYGVKGTIKWDGFSKSLSDDWLPILFAEEEYRITSLVDLLLEVLEKLRQIAPDEELHQLRKRVNEVSLPGEKEKEEILEYLSKRSQETGKRFLLLIDNFHEMLPYFTEEDRGRLRDILMSKDIFMLIGAAPSLFDAVVEYDEPFYNFFEIIWLQEIEDNLVKEVIKKRLMLDGKEELMEKLEKYEDRLRAINHLTGGNPRLILSFYKIFTEFKIIEVERIFIDLLDEMTPYFQDRMKELSPQQRKIVDSIALLDGPSTPTEIANFARLPVNATNTQLGRLKKRGFVKAIKVKNKKETLYDYDINERLFRFWRQMRVEAGRKRLGFIVKFIKVWFTPAELFSQIQELMSELLSNLKRGGMKNVRKLMDKMQYVEEASPLPIKAISHFVRIMGLLASSCPEEAIHETNEQLGNAKAKNDISLQIWTLMEKVFIHLYREDFTKIIKVCSAAIKEYSDTELDLLLPFFYLYRALAYAVMGQKYSAFDDIEKAHAQMLKLQLEDLPKDTLDNLFSLFYIQIPITVAMKEKYQESIEYFEKAPTFFPETPYENILDTTCGTYFKEILKAKKIGLIRRALQIIEESDQTDLIEFLKPYRKAVQFVETGDKSVLNRITPEIRELVEEIVKALKEN